MERLKSEVICELLKLFDSAKTEQMISSEKLDDAAKITQDMLHQIEFGATVKERSKSATILHNVRLDRRYYKDMKEEADILMDYFAEHKDAINQMREILGKMRKMESYHQNRTYKPRYLKYKD